MAGPDATSPPLRAVLLSGDPKLRARARSLCADGWRVAFAPTGYEAAAEILTAPAAALVVDLRAMTASHRGLIELAREKKVPAFGISGRLPSEMASRPGELRPVDIEDVPAILASLARKRANDSAEAEPRPAPQTEEIGQYEPECADEQPPPDDEQPQPDAQPPQPDAQRPRAQRGEPRPERPEAPAEAASPADEPDRADRPAAPKSPGDRLTPEDIASLLEDGP